MYHALDEATHVSDQGEVQVQFSPPPETLDLTNQPCFAERSASSIPNRMARYEMWWYLNTLVRLAQDSGSRKVIHASGEPCGRLRDSRPRAGTWPSVTLFRDFIVTAALWSRGICGIRGVGFIGVEWTRQWSKLKWLERFSVFELIITI